MKRIIVISDTHIPAATRTLPEVIIEELKRSDLCIHAGDYISKQVVETINGYVKLEGVYGNMDSEEVRKMLPEKKVIKVENTTIGIIHGSGSYFNILGYNYFS
jgi:putative phosphoesterase